MDLLPAPTDLKLVEIKCVAEVINFKMCKLLTFGSLPEAFDQFDFHLKTLLPLQGTIEVIAFEHWAYIAKQFAPLFFWSSKRELFFIPVLASEDAGRLRTCWTLLCGKATSSKKIISILAIFT